VKPERVIVKWKVWIRQKGKSVIDGTPLPNVEGDLHEVWVQKSDLPSSNPLREEIHLEPMNLVLTTNLQNTEMGGNNHRCMQYLVVIYGEDAINQWLHSLDERLSEMGKQPLNKTVESCMELG
jgi:hypothetical protein